MKSVKELNPQEVKNALKVIKTMGLMLTNLEPKRGNLVFSMPNRVKQILSSYIVASETSRNWLGGLLADYVVQGLFKEMTLIRVGRFLGQVDTFIAEHSEASNKAYGVLVRVPGLFCEEKKKEIYLNGKKESLDDLHQLLLMTYLLDWPPIDAVPVAFYDKVGALLAYPGEQTRPQGALLLQRWHDWLGEQKFLPRDR